MSEKRSTETTKVNAGELAELILTYFDNYRLGSVAPIVAELEKALDAEYRRGLQEAVLFAPPTTLMIGAADGRLYRLNDSGLWEHADGN